MTTDELLIKKPPMCARCLRRSSPVFFHVTEYRTLLLCEACNKRKDKFDWIAWFERNRRKLEGPGGWVSLDKALLRRNEP